MKMEKVTVEIPSSVARLIAKGDNTQITAAKGNPSDLERYWMKNEKRLSQDVETLLNLFDKYNKPGLLKTYVQGGKHEKGYTDLVKALGNALDEFESFISDLEEEFDN